MSATELGPEDYRFVECPNSTCLLRFPGVPGVACPLCASPCVWVADRCLPAPRSEGRAARPLELLLDNVRSVFNVGSIFRSSDGAGVQGLYLCGITPTPAHKAMDKTALGAQARVRWTHHANARRLASDLLEAGKTLWALEHCKASVDLFDAAEPRPEELVLVLGNEVTGVDPGVLELCSLTLHIPMRGAKNSLNVATAMGVAAYALTAPETGETGPTS